jgi:branched-chain amino acid transport system permease protein
MTVFIQTLIDGIAVGSLYALIALGYTLVYGILKFINFAHSDIFALGAWLSLTVAAMFGVSGIAVEGSGPPPWYVGLGVLLLSMLICSLVGLLIERLAYKPLRRAPRLNVLITAIGVSLLLENVGQLQFFHHDKPLLVPFGPYPKAMPQLLPDRVLATFAGGVQLRLVDVVVLGTALVLVIALQWLIFRTKLGMAMRAVSFNVSTASLMGINSDAIISITFVIGSALAAAAGFLYAVKYVQLKQTADAVWVLLGLKAFVAAVIGGIGNVRGAAIGGIVIGLIEFFGVAYLSSNYRDVYVFLVLIVVLLLKPEGILGRATVEKV